MAITLAAPPGETVFRKFTLSSGRECRPIFYHLGIEVTVETDAEACELESEGWRRKPEVRRLKYE
jgi:hypothetical protein